MHCSGLMKAVSNLIFLSAADEKTNVSPSVQEGAPPSFTPQGATTNPSILTLQMQKSPIMKNHPPALLFLLLRVTSRARG